MRANAARFAAYKANYVRKTLDSILANEKLTPEQRKEHAAQAMSLFHHWGDAEQNFAVQSAQMAQKWQDFAADGDEYLLQYRTAMDEKVREEHAALQGTTLPVDDPFWDKYYPPLGWNCRCTVAQVRRGKYQESDSAKACELGESCTANTPSFRFNPGKAKIAFPDGVSYFRHAGKTSSERKETERQCENFSRKTTVQNSKSLIGTESFCNINGERHTVIFIPQGINEYSQSLQGKATQYWIKNEILPNIRQYIEKAVCVGRKASDTTHNTRAETLRLKRNTDYFYYFKTALPNGEDAYIHLGRYKEGHEREGKLYLYTITKTCPENTETP